VAAPRSVDQLAEVVARCSEEGMPITMRGAGTSIAGNAVGPGLILLTHHLAAIAEVDAEAQTATVGPGVVLDDLQRAAAPYGLRFGPEPSTHDRCTFGGMIGNDACGSRSVRWGSTADNVIGLEAVTLAGLRLTLGPAPRVDPPAAASALVGRLRGLVEPNEELIRSELPRWHRRVSGYALDRLLPERHFDVARAMVGTEGTCAIVTSATVRLVPAPPVRVLLLLAYPDDIAAATEVPPLLDAQPYTVEAMSVELIEGYRGRVADLLPDGDAWLLVEAGGATAAEARAHAGRLAGTVSRRLGDASVRLVEDAAAQRSIWRMREDASGRATRLPDGSPAWPGLEDAVVPPARLAAYLTELRRLLRERGYGGITYGHFGEGCIHVRIGFDLARSEGVARFRTFMEDAADLIVAHGGSLSGEHGDGRARSELLGRMFSPEMLDLFRAFKAAWDPRGLLNPGVLVDPAPIDADLRPAAPTRIELRPELAYPTDGGDVRSAVQRCIGVGRCVVREGPGTMCPSYKVTGEERHSTRGRARLLQELMMGSLADEGWRSTAVRDALDLCLGCKACLTDCPTNVDMATYRSEFLAHHYRGRIRPRTHYSLGWLPAWLRIGSRMPRLANAVLGSGLGGALYRSLGGVAADVPVPRLPRRTFVRESGGETLADPGVPHRGRVVLWPDTFTNHLSPSIPAAALTVLTAAGYDVVVPRSPVCCGLTWMTTGQLGTARSVLRRSLCAPELAGDDPVVVLEPSCAAALRVDAPHLLGHEDAVPQVGSRVRTLAQMLDGIDLSPRDVQAGQGGAGGGEAGHGAAGYGAAGGLPPRRAVVQPHCHQQALLGTEADARVLAAAGIEPAPMLAGCCGMAGDWGAARARASISRDVAGLALTPALAAAGEDTLVLADGFSCRMQVERLGGPPARHLAEVLAERLSASRRTAGHGGSTEGLAPGTSERAVAAAPGGTWDES
jgi:FAD/FMN-containing dehydrogenase/Fe-S oxidoreductase